MAETIVLQGYRREASFRDHKENGGMQSTLSHPHQFAQF